MPNPLFEQFGNIGNNKMFQMVKQFNEFRRTFQGDPKAEVEKILRSGKISQEQWNQIQQSANDFQRMLNLMAKAGK